MNFFDYAARHNFALFPCRAETKIPIVKWTQDSSRDPVQWQAWRDAGNNLAINAAQSGLIILDIDSSKIGRDAAWAAWCKLSAEWGLPAPPEVQCHSARGGWHCYLRRPVDADPASLSGTKILVRDELGNELVGVKVRGYAVAPGSSFESKLYVQLSEAPPHECPPALLDALQLPVISAPSGVAGESDPVDVAALVAFLDSEGEFATEPDWFRALGAIKLALGDSDDGVAVAHQITFEEVTDAEFRAKWDRLSNEPRPRDYTIASMIWRAEQLGRKFHVRRSSKAMFDSVAAALPTPPPGAMSLIGGGPREPRIVAPEYSEIEIADRFANDYASMIRFVTTRRSWVYWTGKRWCADETDYVLDMARLHCRSEAGLCASTPGNTNAQARSINSSKTVNAIVKLAGVDQRIASRAVDWDSDPWLLGTPDGIVDLRTGTLRQAQPEDRITKVTAAAPGGDCPTWLKFLDRATNGDAEMQAYLQRIAGYCLTGDVSEQALFFLDGKGGNGKGVFVNTLQNILKDYAKPTAIETLTASNSDRHPTDIADLLGARLVTCSETERGKRWAESRIKQMTGGDQLSARFTGKDFFAFMPTFKIVVSGNSKPSLRADDAMRRRFQVVPFRVTIPKDEQDKKLADKLKREWAGILAWAVAGAIAWQRDGLNPPASVNDATKDYMDDESEDTLSMWIAERCDTSDPGARTALSELHRSYDAFARTMGERDILSSVRLGKALGEAGYQPVRTGRAGRLRVGIKVRKPAAPVMPFPGVVMPDVFGRSVGGVGQ